MESVIIYEDSQTYNQFIKYASVKNGHLCPACKKPHNNEKDRKLTIMQTHNEYKINCLRKQKDGNVSSITIPISPDIVKRMKEEFKQQPLNTQIKFATEKIPNQDSRYVEFDLDSDLLYVKSNMGSGKTEQLVKHLPPYLKTNNAVMLSVRQTLSTEWMKRYTDAGIQMFDYREITGTIQPQKGAITIIQVDSLCRLSLEDVNILILDEVQSIIAQLNSSQLRDKTGVHNRFVELVKQADKVLCMDANLRESTMDMIDYIRNQTGRLVWNTRQTYQHVDTVIRKFQSKGMDHLLNYYKQKVIIEGKNIIGHVNSFKKATKIVNYLKELKPDLKIKFYHGEDRMPDMLNGVASLHKDVKLHDLNDVKNIWKQQQVVIYTGTISAGIDFSLDHFHENISVFNSRANSADQFMQGLMRCRKLIDNRITLYLQDMNKSAVVTNAQVFKSYTDNMRKFGVSSNNILNPLFNLQVYLQAYEMQQNARPIDIIIATLNLMGMRVSYDALSKEDTTKQELYTKLTSVETKVTKNTLQTVSSISEHSCKFFINRHIQTKVNEMLVEQYNPQIYIDIPLIAFLAAVYKSDIIDQETFKDPVKLHQVMNDRLQRVKQLSQAEQDELLNEYDEYEQYREYKMFQPKDTHITQMSDTQADLHIQNILEIHGKQFNDRQKLKNNKLQNFELPKIASQVKQALEFYRAFVKDPKSEETANIAKSCGVFTRPNYRRIFLKIGVSLKRIKTKESKVVIDGKRKTIRQYNMILKPFFSNTVLYEASDN